MPSRSESKAIEYLPFPIASVLWEFASTADRTRLEPLFNFFEVSAKFTTTVLLSGLATDARMFSSARRSWQGRVSPSVAMKTPTLGSWAALGAGAAKAVRVLAQKDADAVKAAFAVDDHRRVRDLASRDVVAVLDEAVRHRNEWRGHGSIASPVEVERRRATLADRLEHLSGLLANVFDGWKLVYGSQCSYRDDVFECRIDLMVGANPRFAETYVALHNPISADRLHLWCDGEPSALPLAPLVNAFQPGDSSDPAVYFYDRGDAKTTRWLSYHYEPVPERNERPTTLLTGFLAALDEPPDGDPGEGHPASPHTGEWTPAHASAADRTTSVVQELIAACRALGLESTTRNGGYVFTDAGGALGVVGVMSDELSLVANVPIDTFPFLPGSLLWELPVGPAGTPATRFSAYAQGDVAPAFKLLATGLALHRGWELGGAEFVAAIRRAGPVIGGATAPILGWGAGLREAPPPHGLAWAEVWRPVANLLQDAGVGSTPRMLNQPCLRMVGSDSYGLELRIDAFGPVIAIVVHDERFGAELIADLVSHRSNVERAYGRRALWIREMSALRIVDRPYALSGRDDLNDLHSELGTRAADLAKAVSTELRRDSPRT